MSRFQPRTKFSFLQKEESEGVLSKHGREIWELLFSRDRQRGGFFGELTGLMMSGKTSLLLTMCDKALKENSNEIHYWREPERNYIQFLKSKHDSQILCESRYDLQLFEIAKDEPLIPSDDLKIRKFRGLQELISMTKKDMLNVVYFAPDHLYYWQELMDRMRYNGLWKNFWIDEAEDCWPLNPKGEWYHANQRFSDSAKHSRKALENLFYDTQNSLDVDWRIRYKVLCWFYLRGSKVDDISPIFQQAVHNLSEGQAYCDFSRSKFGVIEFKPYYPKDRTYMLIPSDDAGIPRNVSRDTPTPYKVTSFRSSQAENHGNDDKIEGE